MDHSQMVHIMTEDGMVMVHSGIPGWMFGAGVGLVVLLSFIVVEWRGLKGTDSVRLNLTGSKFMRRLMRKRWFQWAFQAPVLACFLFIIYAGLFGNQAKNIAPVITWTVWWAGLIFAVAIMGNVWCFVCPWDAMANLTSRLSFWRKRPSLSMELALPSWLDNMYPALVMFVIITWAELGWGITNNPRQTAILGALMTLGAMIFALVFQKKAFCRSFCLVGRTAGMYAMFSPVEIRARDKRVCDVCTHHACLTGNEFGYACPTGLDMSDLNESTYCTNCTECFKSCPVNVPTVRLRPFGRDLPRVQRHRNDEAWMALTLLSLTAFHGLSMTPVWQNFQPGTTDIVGVIREALGTSQIGAFTVGMVLIMAIPVITHAATTGLAWKIATGRMGSGKPALLAERRRGSVTMPASGLNVSFTPPNATPTFWQMFVAYSYSVLPVALFYHLAHNLMHVFSEGQDLIPLLSDPMGTGADYFGTATWFMAPLFSQTSLWYMQVTLVLVGHIFGVTVAHRIAARLFPDKRQRTLSLIPMLVLMVILSVGGLWLMSLDMNMRVGRM